MKEKLEISKWLDKYGKDLIIVVLLLMLMMRPIFDPDLGWHLRLGKEMIKSGRVVMGDSFSFSLPGYVFINHSWLLDLATFKVFEWFGLYGVNMIYGGFTCAGFWFLYLSLRKKLKYKELSFLLPVFAVYVIEFISLRAHSISFFGVCFLWNVLGSISGSKKRPRKLLWSLPFIFLVWANMHAGFVLGILIWGLWILFGIVEKTVSDRRLSINRREIDQVMLLFSVLLTLINPNGTGVWQFAFELFNNNVSGVYNSDWVPLLSSRLPLDSLAIRWSVLIFGLVGILGIKKYFGEKMVALVFGVMTFFSIRYALVFLILITPLLFLFLEKMVSKRIRKVDWKIFAAISMATVFVVVFNNFPKMICAYESDECYGKYGNYPYESVKYFRENNLQGNVFNFYTWGGYLEWKLPQNKYFIDGRMDSFYVNGESFLSEFVRIVEGDDFVVSKQRNNVVSKDLFEGYDVDYVMLPSNLETVTALSELGWRTIIKTDTETLLTRN